MKLFYSRNTKTALPCFTAIIILFSISLHAFAQSGITKESFEDTSSSDTIANEIQPMEEDAGRTNSETSVAGGTESGPDDNEGTNSETSFGGGPEPGPEDNDGINSETSFGGGTESEPEDNDDTNSETSFVGGAESKAEDNDSTAPTSSFADGTESQQEDGATSTSDVTSSTGQNGHEDTQIASDPDNTTGEENAQDAPAADGTDDIAADNQVDEQEAEEPEVLEFDPQPQTMQEVEDAIAEYTERFEALQEAGDYEAALALPKPRWEFAVPEDLMPEGYYCDYIDNDENFGAGYYTFFEEILLRAMARDSDGYLIITSPEELDEVRNALDEKYRLGNSIDLTGYVSATSTANNGWQGIGSSESAPFTGEFDGQNYTISGLKSTYANASGIGLFRYINGATISNLTVETVETTGTVNAMYGAIDTGVIVGKANDSSIIENCTVTVKGRVNGGAYGNTGGIVGSAHNKTTIRNCEVTIEGAGITASYQVGGIVGKANNGVLIEGCRTIGGPLNVTGGGYLGGIAGHTNIATTNVNGSIEPQPNAEYVTIKDCYVDAEDKLYRTSGNYTGGIIGTAYKTDVISCATQNTNVNVNSYGGGILGVAYGASHITDCHAESPTVESRAPYAGGFGGACYNELFSTSGYTTITDCTVSNAQVNSNYNENAYVGGFFGVTYEQSSVTNCRVKTAKVIGRTYTGGFAAAIYNNSVITGCSVEDMQVVGQGVGNYVGGFAGVIYNNSDVSHCYGNEITVNMNGYGAGGFAADIYDYATVSNSYVTNVEVSANTPNAGAFSGNIRGVTNVSNCYAADFSVTVATFGGEWRGSGGFVGVMYEFPTVTDCFAASGSVSDGYYNVGGFVGQIYGSSKLKNCYTQADVLFRGTMACGGFAGRYTTSGGSPSIENCYSTGSVNATSIVQATGGFIGHMGANVPISNCYSTGTINIPAASGNSGGFIGQLGFAGTPNVTNCYYDVTTTRRENTTTDARLAGVAKLTTTQMIAGSGTAGSFINFAYQATASESGNTNSPWYIDEGKTYPYLYYQYNGHTRQDREYNLAAVYYSDGTSLGQPRADFTFATGKQTPFSVRSAGARWAYFPYAGRSMYNISAAGSPVPDTPYSRDTSLYSLGGVSATGIVAFSSAPAAEKSSDRPVYSAGDPTSYTYVGDVVTYDIAIANYSTEYDWRNVVLSDPLPEGVTLVPGSEVLLQYDGGTTVSLPRGGATIPYYEYNEASRLLTVYLGTLYYSGSVNAPNQATVSFRADVGEDALSDQPLNPSDNNIRNVGEVTGQLYDPAASIAIGDYSTPADDRNTDPVFTIRVWYDGNGHTGGAPPMDSKYYRPNDSVTILDRNTLERTSMYFYGWSLDPNADPDDPSAYNLPGTALTLAYSDITLYAVWGSTPLRITSFDFYKVDTTDYTQLAGVTFALYYCSNPAHTTPAAHDDVREAGSCWVKPSGGDYTSASDGLVSLGFNAEGLYVYYLLEETETIGDYALPGTVWVFELTESGTVNISAKDANPYAIAFENDRDIDGDTVNDYYLRNLKKNYELPATGGRGWPFLPVGCLLLAGGGVLLLPRTNRHRPKNS